MRHIITVLVMALSSMNLCAKCPDPKTAIGHFLSILDRETPGLMEYFEAFLRKNWSANSFYNLNFSESPFKFSEDFEQEVKILQAYSLNNPLELEEINLPASTRCNYYLITPVKNEILLSFELKDDKT